MAENPRRRDPNENERTPNDQNEERTDRRGEREVSSYYYDDACGYEVYAGDDEADEDDDLAEVRAAEKFIAIQDLKA